MIKTPDLSAHWARLKAVMERKRGERGAENGRGAHENRAPRARRMPWLITIPASATLFAAGTEIYWAWLFVIEACGLLTMHWDIAADSNKTGHNAWDVAFSTNAPVLFGLVLASIPIVMWSMIWLPAQMEARGTGRWRRVSMVLAGLICNALVITSGTIVMNANRQEHVRAGLVVEQTAAQGKAGIQAQIDAVNADLARLTDKRTNNEYAATAANIGPEAYKAAYMSPDALANSPPARKDIIIRAYGAALTAKDLKAQRTALIAKLADAPTAASTAANVEDHYGAGMNTFAQYVDAYRPPVWAFACTLIGILGAFWLVGILKDQPYASSTIAIEDHSDEVPLAPQPYVQPVEKKESYFDEDGNRIVRRRQTWAKVPVKKSGKKKDETLYEQAARMSENDPRSTSYQGTDDERANATGSDGYADRDSQPSDQVGSGDDRVSPGPTADAAIPEFELSGTHAAENFEPADAAGPDAGEQETPAETELQQLTPEPAHDDRIDEPEAPATEPPPASDDAIDAMIAAGAAEEKEDGLIQPKTEAAREAMLQGEEGVREFMARERGLPSPKPNGKLEHMQ